MSATINVTCIAEPRGVHGLEGYQLGETYRALFIDQTAPGYWRIWPTEGDYYEIADKKVFRRFFKPNPFT